MKTLTQNKISPAKAIRRFALRNYETYKLHCESRNFAPMPLNDFLKNYNG